MFTHAALGRPVGHSPRRRGSVCSSIWTSGVFQPMRMPKGVLRGMPKGVLRGIPTGLLSGVPQGVPRVVVQVSFRGIPTGVLRGVPKGVPRGVARGG